MDDGVHRNVSRETLGRLTIYADLLKKWTRRINLISPGTVDALWSRHIADSAQLFDIVACRAGIWADLGSGGGLPGAVIAILAAERAPDLRVICVESDARKAVFLQTVSRETGVPFDVIVDRVEQIAPLGAAVVSARALAPLDVLLDHAARHLADGGVGLFPKGAQHEKERRDAEKNWQFRCEAITSKTDPSAIIYKVGVPRRA